MTPAFFSFCSIFFNPLVSPPKAVFPLRFGSVNRCFQTQVWWPSVAIKWKQQQKKLGVFFQLNRGRVFCETVNAFVYSPLQPVHRPTCRSSTDLGSSSHLIVYLLSIGRFYSMWTGLSVSFSSRNKFFFSKNSEGYFFFVLNVQRLPKRGCVFVFIHFNIWF